MSSKGNKERTRRKMEGDKNGEGEMRRSKRRGSLQQRVINFEERFKRKMENHGAGGSKYEGSKHGKARRMATRENRSSSLPAQEPAEGSGRRRPARRRLTWTSWVSSMTETEEVAKAVVESMACEEWVDGGERRESNEKSNGGHILDEGTKYGVQTQSATADREARLEASGVAFEEIFVHLRRFNEENGSLMIPDGHPLLTHILNTLSSVGMEELLREHWDQQLTKLRAFKEKYGDCLVPEAHPTLGAWARIQRDQYLKYARRLPNSLTRERVNKLKELGFDKFVSWVREDKQKHGRESVGRTSSESEDAEAVINLHNLTLDEKIKRKKRENRNKFMERGLIAHNLVEGGEEPGDKAAVAKEMHKKRMMLRTARRGLGPRASSRLVAQTLREDSSHRGMGQTASSRVIPHTIREEFEATIREDMADDHNSKAATSSARGGRDSRPVGLEQDVEGYSFLLRSSSCSDLCPGSWECKRCTYINKPAEPGEGTVVCRACGAREDEEGVREDGGEGSRRLNLSLSRDDLLLDSSTSFGHDVLHAVMTRSVSYVGGSEPVDGSLGRSTPPFPGF